MIIKLTQKNRAILRVAANQGNGSREELRQYIKLAELLGFDEVPPEWTACEAVKTADFDLSADQYELIKKIFLAVPKWPFALAEFVSDVDQRFDVADSERKSKKKKSKIVGSLE